MCGIWGYISTEPIDANQHNMNHRNGMEVQPRGPERTVVKQSDYYTLMFHRLAINGVSEDNDQPYVYEVKDKGQIVDKYIVMCNGEIYNCDDIRDYLTGDGVRGMYGNKCDTTCIFPLFQYLGFEFDATVQRLHGEFALAIIRIDVETNEPTQMWCSVDPLSIRPLFIARGLNFVIFSSTLAGVSYYKRVDNENVSITRLEGGSIFEWRQRDKTQCYSYIDWHPTQIAKNIDPGNLTDIKHAVVDILEQCVKRRMMSDRPIGCFLSGGLDSSLIAALVARELRNSGGGQLHTFSIGAEDSRDVQCAQLVASHINSIHTHVPFDAELGLKHLVDVIHATETFDITTIRASVGQFLISKYIAENTDIKVVFSGDGADEAEMGYLYFLRAPSAKEANEESRKLLREIHLYDGLRVDRCVSYNGLEARVPYLDWEFVKLMLAIPAELKTPKLGERCEKWLLRDAFQTLRPQLLPSSVLWRTKETFSDSLATDKTDWYTKLQEYVAVNEQKQVNTTHCPPYTTESNFYRSYFNKFFGEVCASVIPHFWMPQWSNTTDPSARTLEVYETAQTSTI